MQKQSQPNNVLPNFEEECKGLSQDEAIIEANRCLNCKKPICKAGCPIANNIPEFIQEIKKGNFKEAYHVISETSNLPAICGRVCPHEKQCQGACILNNKGTPVQISKLERFVADLLADEDTHQYHLITPKNKKIAVIGSGPAGLSAAGDLAKIGYTVTIYEAEEALGGVLTYGIPEYRLPKRTVENEINKLRKLGVTFLTNTVIGEDITIDELFAKGYQAIFIASGAGSPRKLEIRGVYLPGVYYANYLLATINLVNIGKLRKEEIPIHTGDRVAVIGAGNVAMDAARSCKRLGAEDVKIIYRRDCSAMPALQAEITACEHEGVEFLCLTNPIKILGTTRVTGLQCTKMHPDEDGQLREVPDSLFNLDVNRVILAIGQRPRSRIVSSTDNLITTKDGYVKTLDEKFGYTTKGGVFAGGDVVTTPKTVVSAMKQGKLIALEIDKYLQAKEQ